MRTRLSLNRWPGLVAALVVACGGALHVRADKPPADDDPAPAEAALEAVYDAPAAVVGVDAGFETMPAEGVADDEEARLAPYRQQYLPLVRRELTFANRVNAWSDDQRQAAVDAARAWLEAFIRKQVAGQVQARQGVMVFAVGGWAQAGGLNNPGAAAESELIAAIRATLTPEQQTAYDEEVKARRAYRKQTVIDNLVAQLDEKLSLTVQQCEKIARSLHVRWDDSWAPPMEAFVHMADYVPVVPDETIIPHLTPEQRTLWSGLQKVSFAGGVNFGQELFPANVGFDEFDVGQAK